MNIKTTLQTIGTGGLISFFFVVISHALPGVAIPLWVTIGFFASLIITAVAAGLRKRH